MVRIKKETIVNNLIGLGLKKRDTLFIAADLLRVGYFSGGRDKTMNDWIDILLSIVGAEGTLVIPAYTQSFFRFFKNRNIVFSVDCTSTSGALSAAFQKYPGVARSKHPTNSCFAIGKNAEYILDGHDEHASSYLPYRKVVDCNGKNLMIGAFSDDRLSPMAMHCAQETLGLTKKHYLAGKLQSYFVTSSGDLGLFTRLDAGGCTAGGYKTYGHHILSDAISFGFVGNGMSALIDCKKSLEIFLDILTNNPDLVKCDNKRCASCYGSPILWHPLFWLKKITYMIKRSSIVKIIRRNDLHGTFRDLHREDSKS